jgi:hypothetical protein
MQVIKIRVVNRQRLLLNFNGKIVRVVTGI